jgi:hypothetical protein
MRLCIQQPASESSVINLMPKQNVFNFVLDYKMTLPFLKCQSGKNHPVFQVHVVSLCAVCSFVDITGIYVDLLAFSTLR